MVPNNTYCFYAQNCPEGHVHKVYHDQFYGFPIEDDHELFGRLILEINQAGLSWTTILHKAENFREAYENYDIRKIASYGDEEEARLLKDAGIIRNKLKVKAAINNAQSILQIQEEFGSFKSWLDQNVGLEKNEWVKLFKSHFKFVGGEIVNEFLMSTGYLPGAHHPECPTFNVLQGLALPYLNAGKQSIPSMRK
jgi:DNA-3-methyladenine glycosylase I